MESAFSFPLKIVTKSMIISRIEKKSKPNHPVR